MPLGAIALYIIFGAILWAWHPPGVSAADDKAENAPARTPRLRVAHVARISRTVPAGRAQACPLTAGKVAAGYALEDAPPWVQAGQEPAV